MKNTCSILLYVLLATPALSACAQDGSQMMTQKERGQLVGRISTLLLDNYIFPDVAEEMVIALNEGLQSTYSTIDDPKEFAESLTRDLQAISNDRHMRIVYDPEALQVPGSTGSSEDRAASMKSYMDKLKRENYGFKELKILDGNIGYLNLTGFVNTDHARETAVDAMNFLAATDAVIIDLRENGGGSPTMIQLITTYFFEGDPIHLNTFYNRPNDETWESWTLADVPGKRMPDVDLYLLTSNYTFSAAEEFAYNLRNLNRATIVGETTGGGAHPVDRRMISDRFMISLPIGRAINPISQTNWEGVGVEPHVKVDREEALNIAQKMAVQKLDVAVVGEKK
jgi:retinol-binding protein 3